MNRPVRPPATIRVIFRHGSAGWTATSPDVTGFSAGPVPGQVWCQQEAIRLLNFWISDHVTLELSVEQ